MPIIDDVCPKLLSGVEFPEGVVLETRRKDDSRLQCHWHLALVDRGTVLTSRTVACPEGITRATVLDLCREHAVPCEERDLTLTEVYRADELFCTGTMGELAPVLKVDGRTIGTGRTGPVTQRLMRHFAELTSHAGERIVD